MDYKQIHELIRQVSKYNISELKIEEKDFKITLRSADYRPGIITSAVPTVASAPAPTPAPQASAGAEEKAPAAEPAKPSAPAADDADNSKYITVKSPMIGTFYRSPGPDKDVFVKVGDVVDKGTVLCIIEAMKLFNDIESDVKGKIVKVLVDDASPVEYDQPLFLIDPKGA